jgi:hypothetical protein
VHHAAVEVVGDHLAPDAAGVPVGAEHELVDEQLRASSKSCARVLVPSSVSNVYGLSIRTQGSSRRMRASWSLRRVCSFSSLSSSTRAVRHSSRVPVWRLAMTSVSCWVCGSPAGFSLSW